MNDLENRMVLPYADDEPLPGNDDLDDDRRFEEQRQWEIDNAGFDLVEIEEERRKALRETLLSIAATKVNTPF
jgi:hypothetical protein